MRTTLLHVLILFLAALSPRLASSTDISITPSDSDRTIFQEGDFRRTCTYSGSEDIYALQILHNGSVVDQVTDNTLILLDVMGAELHDAGTYECLVVFTDNSTSNNISMGSLTVVDLNLIVAAPNQYVVAGEDITLQCSFNDPARVYGIPIPTVLRDGQPVQEITNASIDDEGLYQCDIALFLLQEDSDGDSKSVPITLHVFTPIVITEHPPVYQKLTGVQRANFSVTFTGREAQGIETMWYHNGVTLYNKQHQLMTSFSSESLTGTATIKFDQMARGDRGVYRVVVETDFGAEVIDVSLRKKEYSFQVDVRVPPPNPVDFVADVVAEHHAQLKWVLPITHPDEDADIFLLDMSFPNGSIASSLTLGSSARSVNVSVLPGVSYKVRLIARNEDGSGNNTLRFTTPPATPLVSSFEARRLNETHFNVSITLNYTGGGDTTTFSIYFREHKTIQWSQAPVMVVQLDAEDALKYHGTISGEEIRGKGPLEFELRVENGMGFMGRKGPVLEISDPPGAPINPIILEESDTSVTIDFQLPQEGTPPFINIILNFSEPQSMMRNYTGTYMPGQKFQAKVNDLSPKTAYTLKARAVNYAGNGPDSEPISFTTNETPPTTTPTSVMSSMPWILPAAIGGGLVVVMAIIIIFLFCCCYCCYQRRKRFQNTLTTKQLEPDHEMLQREKASQITLPSAVTSMDTLEKKTNTYIQVPQHNRPVSAASSNMSNQKRHLENSNRRGSSSTLNSGSAMQQSQDSFSKKQEIFSIGSESRHSSFQSSLHSHRTSRDSLGVRRTKVVNPSLSSVSSGSTETADRHQTTPFLPPQLEETYSFQTIPFTPKGSSYHTQESSHTYSVEPQSQYISDV